MKIYGIKLLLLMACYGSVLARDVLLEAKGAYYIATGDRFRDIYGTGGGRYGAELTVEFCRNIYGWVSAEGFTKHGCSIGGKNPTKLTLVPLGFGFKYFHEVDCGDLYVGLGVLATQVTEKDCSPFVIPRRCDWTAGGIVKAGWIVDLPRCFFIDFFVDYSCINIKFCRGPSITVQSCKANIGGVALGAGIGYRF